VALISLILLVISYSLHAAKWLQAIILIIFLVSAFAFTFSTGWQHYKERN
jgi:predicted membrane channel-forming protein YqfA (hemolysin III family)